MEIPPRFIATGELGRLAKQLRMLGFDCCYDGEIALHSAILRAAEENRVLLVQKPVAETVKTRIIHIRSGPVDSQLSELAQMIPLVEHILLLSRCLVCNRKLSALKITKTGRSIEHENGDLLEINGIARDDSGTESKVYQVILPESVVKRALPLHYCLECQRVYWRGSHVERMINNLIKAGIPIRDD